MRPVTVDRLVVAACALSQLVTVTPGHHAEPGPTASSISLAIGLATAAALLARRSRPVPVVVVAAVAYPVQVALVGPVPPVTLLFAGYAAARYGPALIGPIVAAAAATAATAAVLLTGADVAATYAVVLLLTVLAAGLLTSVAARQDERTRTAVLDERMRIARDLHDVVGHGMGAITVQAGAGRMALDAGAESDVRSALVTIEQVGRNVLRDVRWLVGLLRDRPGAPRLSDLPELVVTAGHAGLSVRFDITGPADQVPAEAAEAAYRVVQEGLTNVLRHSNVASATVAVAVGPELTVEVLDDGAGRPGTTEGNGIRGLRERVRACGGDVEAGPQDAGGWRLAAVLPIHQGRRAGWWR